MVKLAGSLSPSRLERGHRVEEPSEDGQRGSGGLGDEITLFNLRISFGQHPRDILVTLLSFDFNIRSLASGVDQQ